MVTEPPARNERGASTHKASLLMAVTATSGCALGWSAVPPCAAIRSPPRGLAPLVARTRHCGRRSSSLRQPCSALRGAVEGLYREPRTLGPRAGKPDGEDRDGRPAYADPRGRAASPAGAAAPTELPARDGGEADPRGRALDCRARDASRPAAPPELPAAWPRAPPTARSRAAARNARAPRQKELPPRLRRHPGALESCRARARPRGRGTSASARLRSDGPPALPRAWGRCQAWRETSRSNGI